MTPNSGGATININENVNNLGFFLHGLLYLFLPFCSYCNAILSSFYVCLNSEQHASTKESCAWFFGLRIRM